MAFMRNIDIERRAYIKLLLISTYSYRKISKLTKASTSSIARINETLDMESGQLIPGITITYLFMKEQRLVLPYEEKLGGRSMHLLYYTDFTRKTRPK